jgi:hypothetical protein
MKQTIKKKFTSPLTAGIFFGLIGAGISILCFNLPLQQSYEDFISATALLVCVLASVYFLTMMVGAENFYRLFVSSFLTFCIWIFGIWGYLTLAKDAVQLQWLTLLGGGAMSCFIIAFIANILRRQKSA